MVLNQRLDFPLFSPLFFLILLGENLSCLLKGVKGGSKHDEKINSVILISLKSQMALNWDENKKMADTSTLALPGSVIGTLNSSAILLII